MNQLKFALLCCCYFVGYTNLWAQDPHFSQYFTSPMTMNPALTAKAVDDWRGGMNMRSQWWGGSIKPYYTITASIEKAMVPSRKQQNYWGLGGMVVSDQSNGGLLKNNYFSFSTAYHLGLDAAGKQELSAGLTGTYANRLLDRGKFLFQSQVGSMGFQRDVAANDPIDIQKSTYFDVSAGLYYSYTGDRYGFNAGGALFHASSPNEGVYNNSQYNIPRKTSLQAGSWIQTGNGNVLHISSFAEFQGKNSIYALGGVYKMGMTDELLRSVNLGVWNRFGDALYPYFALETKRWVAGFTYDFVNSGVSNYSSVQSMELSFVWQFGKTRGDGHRAAGVLIY